MKWNYETFYGLYGATTYPYLPYKMIDPLDPLGLPQGVPWFQLQYIKLTLVPLHRFWFRSQIWCKIIFNLNFYSYFFLRRRVWPNVGQIRAKIFQFWKSSKKIFGMLNAMKKLENFVNITFFYLANFGQNWKVTLEKSYVNKIF